MSKLLLIGLGSGLGGMLRFLTASFALRLLGTYYPFGTLIVNLTGSFLIGLCFSLLAAHTHEFSQSLRALIMVGFLGGFTTFSAFSLETIQLIEESKYHLALFNLCIVPLLCVFFAYIGMVLGRAYG